MDNPLLTIQTADGVKAQIERTPSGGYAVRYTKPDMPEGVSVSRCNYFTLDEASEKALHTVLLMTAAGDEPEPHASDCASWAKEPCNCVTGQEPPEAEDDMERARR